MGLKIYEIGCYEEAGKADKEFKEWKANYLRQKRETAENDKLMDNK